jgi:NAD(P)-dependent dehydrogenase (short-subunit alcohol dehydrogenase family)
MKHIFITGSTRGIGFWLAFNFLKAGCRVTINGTTEKKVNSALDRLNQLLPGSPVRGFSGDVTIYEDVQKMCREAAATSGKIDIWINNAGIDQTSVMAWELDACEYIRIIQVNVVGMINGTKAAFAHLLENGGGIIYNMAGFGSDGRMMVKMGLYGTSKRAVDYFTRSLMKEAAGTPVKVGLLSPGMVMTDMIYNRLGEKPIEPRTRRVFNILADKPQTVTPYLVGKILNNSRNGAHIRWLNSMKISWRFMTASFNRRDFFSGS